MKGGYIKNTGARRPPSSGWGTSGPDSPSLIPPRLHPFRGVRPDASPHPRASGDGPRLPSLRPPGWFPWIFLLLSADAAIVPASLSFHGACPAAPPRPQSHLERGCLPRGLGGLRTSLKHSRPHQPCPASPPSLYPASQPPPPPPGPGSRRERTRHPEPACRFSDRGSGNRASTKREGLADETQQARRHSLPHHATPTTRATLKGPQEWRKNSHS